MRGGKKPLALMRARSHLRRHDPFALHLDARDLDRAQPLDRRDHALRQVIMAGARVGEENDLERRRCHNYAAVRA